MCRLLKTDDEAVFIERIEFRDQQLEAITVICELKRLNEYFSMSISLSEDMADAKWLSLAISMPTKIIMRLYLPF